VRVLLVCLLCASPALALPDTPVPKSRLNGIERLRRPETLAVLQGLAVLADAKTTHDFVSRGCVEVDPLTRPLIGLRPAYSRMIPLGIAEVAASYALARKWPRLRWLQVGFTASHGGAAFHNLGCGR
jgi:hypothetical protein